MPENQKLRSTLRGCAFTVVLLAATAACSDDADTTATSTTTTEMPATSAPATSEATTTTTTTPAAELNPEELAYSIWPWVSSDVRYDDPVEAARGFAEDFIGFTDPLIGEFMQGDTRSGEIQVRPTEDGPVTLLLVRQFGTGDHWWVMAALTENIELYEPAPRSAIDSPLQLSGRSLAFEGTVQVAIWADGSDEPLGEGFVMGGGTQLAPFEGEIAFDVPQGGWGSVVLYTVSMEDGRVWEAAAMRVGFIGGD